jgi:hypothetical protein
MKIGTFVKANIGGLIFSVIIVVIADIIAIAGLDFGSGKYVAQSILHIPVIFIAWCIGNAIRKVLHPDFVVTQGFFGLLKEKIFWKIGPQCIIAMIALSIMTNVTTASVIKSNAASNAERLVQGTGSNGDRNSAASGPAYLEITKQQFIETYAKGKEFIDTDIEKAYTLIRRGNKYLRISGTATRKQIAVLFLTEPSDAVDTSSNEGIFLDLSDVVGWATDHESSGKLNVSEYIDTIVLSDEFTEIPNYFLSGEVKNIYLPNGTTKIGKNAFEYCGNLAGIVIPSSVTEIGNGAFAYCYQLSFVYFSKDSKLTNIDAYAFYGAELTNFVMPPQLEHFGGGCLEEVTALVFPETIKSIGAFSEAMLDSKLVSVTILAQTPPEVTKFTFPTTIQNIYVPAESLKAYEDAWYEHDFTFNGQLKAIK